jgi:Icc-related predicted phosphoesterase
MTTCLFVADLHGSINRYRRLFKTIVSDRPAAVFIGGDLFPPQGRMRSEPDFLQEIMIPGFSEVKEILGAEYPRVFLIMGNDDLRAVEGRIIEAGSTGIWEYVHNRKTLFQDIAVYGYAYVPPTPFRLKDWERYDVSRYTDPGCIPPDEGWCSIPESASRRRYGTIMADLHELAGQDDLSRAIFLFHTPPYETRLDLAALAGRYIDHAPLDPHVGSIAVRRFIETRQPLLTLHGHVHESARLSGSWRDLIGTTHLFSAAHDGDELAVVIFAPDSLPEARRVLLA